MDEPVAELRTDWLTGRSVLVAENRALRPNEFAGRVDTGGGFANDSRSRECAFCAGYESRTPPAVYQSVDDRGQWQVRIVPNRYPALAPPDAMTSGLVATAIEPHATTSPIVGAHEVIIESAQHLVRMSALSKSGLRSVLGAYSVRLQHWRSDGRFRYGLVFKNQGPRAGASIAHLHSQLIALPLVPPVVEAEQQRAAEAFSLGRSCPYCDLVAKEQATGKRIIFVEDGFIAFCPFASWQPHEVWLTSVEHVPSFELVDSGGLDRLTNVLHYLISRFESIVPDAAYNLLLRTAPWMAGCERWSHWRIELMPRTNNFAGLELATGIHINPLAPERAARHLQGL